MLYYARILYYVCYAVLRRLHYVRRPCYATLYDISGVFPGVMKQVSSVAIWATRRGPVLSDDSTATRFVAGESIGYNSASASGPRPSLSLLCSSGGLRKGLRGGRW